ncbi:tRNA lysidine(34) synthetase TilS [Sporomusa termitida]|uniref:tRNA(Ile)-lysidine synthase n=1 Tax=Sporomusa termitida TaxID=2377 RepID=A0A517E185_9FIRM|nr:tRNA lysidine(34) synthetase TilS [Sporomusa termitida]QDR83365.1 tRNA(Ile)-lysidine synthase [Sporomusa termitida]
MLAKVKAWVSRHRLLVPGSRILAACSGGPDSLALVHILNQLKDEYGFCLAVAHMNHMFRPEAAQEAEFVAAFSAGLGLACQVTSINVPGYQQANKLSAEEAGRILRYQYLRQVAADWGGAQIATGHHRDDQAETVLINLLRGAGSGGLRGMQPLSGDIIRPLLAVSRWEIEEYCLRQQLAPCQDSSNLTTDYLRNRVRLNLLPVLEADYNPAIREALWRLAVLAGDEHDYIYQEAGKLWGTIINADRGKAVINSRALADLHPALQRACIRQVIEKKRGTLTGISFIHVENLTNMALAGEVGSQMTLPGGLTARKTYTTLEVGAACITGVEHRLGTVPSEVAIPGITRIDSLTVTAEIVSAPAAGGRATAVFDLEQLCLPVTLRGRRPGDRFRPLGLNGSKKIKDFFIDSKVPESQRDSVPIVSDQQEIIWVAGYRQSEHGRITGNTKKILQLSITKQEEI